MGISHIEDLSVPEFLKVIENLGGFKATEKLDGANLSFGFESDGRFFTSRESKHSSAQRIYDAESWPNVGSSNTFKTAHLALESVIEDLKRVVQPGQQIEIEVLFGGQPNAVIYRDDKSYIAFIQGVNGTSNDVVDRLTVAMQGKTTNITCPILSSPDGVELVVNETNIQYAFIGPQNVELDDVVKSSELEPLVKKLNDFLVSPASGLPEGVSELTNGELSEVKLNTIKTDFREDVKLLREKINAEIRRDYFIPIKEVLIKLLLSRDSSLAPESTEDSVGIEGIVLNDPSSPMLVKIVDRNKFTALNAFNHVMRRLIGGQVKSVNPDANLESRGGVMGHMKIQIATMIGEPEMARSSQMRRIMSVYNIDGNPVNTVKAFADAHKPEDFQAFKRKTLAVAGQTLKDLSTLLERFNAEYKGYKLHLNDGKVIGYTDEIVSRTYLAFAEAKADTERLISNIKKSNNFALVIAHIYKNAIHKQSDEPIEVVESVLCEKRYETDVARYANKDPWTLLNIYFATVFLSALMYKCNDRIGLRILKDKTHFRMERWTKEMSPLNFWGYPIWRSGTTSVKKLIGSKTAKMLNGVTRRVPPAWFRFLHMDLSFGRDVPINWADHYKTMKVLQQYPGMNVERINTILKGIFSFENLTYDQRIKVLNQLYYYVQQFIPHSPLFIRFKAIYHIIVNNGVENNDIMIIAELLNSDPIKVRETADAGSTGAGSVNTLPGSIFGGNRPTVVKRKRNPNIKFIKFKKPDDCPLTSVKGNPTNE